MKFISDETRRKRAELVAACHQLEDVEATLDETPEYLAANQAVNDAAEKLPLWKRLDIILFPDLHAKREDADEDVA